MLLHTSFIIYPYKLLHNPDSFSSPLSRLAKLLPHLKQYKRSRGQLAESLSAAAPIVEKGAVASTCAAKGFKKLMVHCELSRTSSKLTLSLIPGDIREGSLATPVMLLVPKIATHSPCRSVRQVCLSTKGFASHEQCCSASIKISLSTSTEMRAWFRECVLVVRRSCSSIFRASGQLELTASEA